MLNICKIVGLLSLSTALLLNNSGLARSQDINSSVLKLPVVRTAGNYTVKLKSCKWIQDNIICKFSFSNRTNHPKYKFTSDSKVFTLSDFQIGTYSDEASLYMGNSPRYGFDHVNIGFDSPELDRLKTYEINIFAPKVPDNTIMMKIDLLLYDKEQTPDKMKFAFENIPLPSSTSSSAPSSESTGETNSSNTANDICPNSERQIVKAETKNFDLYICGDNRPIHYIGRAKKGGNSITLPLSSQNGSKFVAKNANISYTLTPEFLTVTEDGRTIQKESVRNWIYLNK